MDAVDPALRRSGRFDAEIEVTTPSEEERFQILQVMQHILTWTGCISHPTVRNSKYLLQMVICQYHIYSARLGCGTNKLSQGGFHNLL